MAPKVPVRPTIIGPLDPVTHAPTTARFGQKVCFTTDQDPSTYPWLEVQVHNIDTRQLMFSEVNGCFPTATEGMFPDFQMGPTFYWPSGPGAGSVELFLSVHGTKRKVLATITFPVEG